jgi:hypothetical protein
MSKKKQQQQVFSSSEDFGVHSLKRLFFIRDRNDREHICLYPTDWSVKEPKLLNIPDQFECPCGHVMDSPTVEIFGGTSTYAPWCLHKIVSQRW